MELSIKDLVRGLSRLLESASASAAGLQEGLDIVQHAVGEITVEVAKIEVHAPARLPQDDAAADGEDADVLTDLPGPKAIEDLVVPVVRGLARLSSDVNSGWATSEEYLESLRVIETSCDDVLALMDESHRMTLRLRASLNDVVTKTMVASGAWPGPNAVDDLRAALFDFAQVLRQVLREEKDDFLLDKEASMFVTRRPSYATVRGYKRRSNSASTASISSQEEGLLTRPATRSSSLTGSLVEIANGDIFDLYATSSQPATGQSSPSSRRPPAASALRVETRGLTGDADAKTALIAALQRLAMQVKLRRSELAGAAAGADTMAALREAAQQLGLVAKNVVSTHIALVYRPPSPRSPSQAPVPAASPTPSTPGPAPQTQPPQAPVVVASGLASTRAVFYTAAAASPTKTDPLPQPPVTPKAAASASAQPPTTPTARAAPSTTSPPSHTATTFSAATAAKLLAQAKSWTETLRGTSQQQRQHHHRDREAVANDITTLLSQSHRPLRDALVDDSKTTFDEPPALPASNVFVTGVALPDSEFQALLADDVTELVLEVSPSTGKTVIRGGSPRQLVSRLTYHKHPDTDYIEAFLLTYRSFMQPLDVLSAIIARYEQAPPLNMSKAQFDSYYRAKVIPSRLRVFNVLKTWVDKHFEDFDSEPQLEERFLLFVMERRTHHYYQGNAFLSAASQLKRLYEKKKRSYLDGVRVLLMSRNLPTSLSLSSLTTRMCDVDAGELAKQLTLIDHGLYKAIKPHECLNQAWNKPELRAQSPNILALIKRFNELTKRVCFEILSLEGKKERASAIKQFVAVAEKCFALNNFNSLNAILAAVSSSGVRRLAKTWELVPKKTSVAFEELSRQMSHDANHAAYRNVLHTADPPCVPFLGVSLTDLVFIEQGNKDYLSPGIVNFDKCRKTAESIREIQQYQQTPYDFAPIHHLQGIILQPDGAQCSDDDFYELSIRHEPRKPSAPGPGAK